MSSNRAGFRQLNAACICRPHRRPLFGFGRTKWLLPTHPVTVWTDDAYAVGDELEVDVFPGDGTTLEFIARVEWTQEIPAGDPAAWRVGLRLSSKSASQRDALHALLD